MQYAIFGIIWLGIIVAAIVFGLRYQSNERARKRLFYTPAAPKEAPKVVISSGEPRGLERWLFLAGERQPDAVKKFLITQGICTAIGIGAALYINSLGVVDNLLVMIGANHGGQLDIIAPLIYFTPYVACLILMTLPSVKIRSKRRERVQTVEQDLPLTLEILSTLVETGLSFDPALSRVLDSQPAGRPLTQELKTFRDETRAGRPRVEAFRRMARRVEVLSLSTFVSAIVQAEQAGGGIGTVLIEQSQDLRKRRRECALEAATALPVKQLIPLFICFLPGIFIWALGPTMFKLVNFFDTFAAPGGPPK